MGRSPSDLRAEGAVAGAAEAPVVSGAALAETGRQSPFSVRRRKRRPSKANSLPPLPVARLHAGRPAAATCSQR